MTAENAAWQETAGFAFLPAPDALWRQTPLPLTARYQPLGAALEFATNAPVLAALAADAFGPWGAPDPQAPALRLHAMLHTAPLPIPSAPRPQPLMRAQGDYFMLAVENSLALADRAHGFGVAFISPALLNDHLFVQEGFLECLGFFLATHSRRVVLHAAALVHQGRCVLLTGHGGAGKSTLAFACLQAGMQLVAEDVVYLAQEETTLTAWGSPWRLHLLPDGERFFPELATWPLVTQLNGEVKRRIEVNRCWPGAAAISAPVAGLLTATRAAGAHSRLVSLDAPLARAALLGFSDQMGPDYLPEMRAAVERLLNGRTAGLEVGHDPHAAAALLRAWLDAG